MPHAKKQVTPSTCITQVATNATPKTSTVLNVTMHRISGGSCSTLSSVSLPHTSLVSSSPLNISSDHDDDEVIEQDSNAELTADTELAMAYLETSSNLADESAGAAPPTDRLPIAGRAAALELQRAPGQQTSPEASLAAIHTDRE